MWLMSRRVNISLMERPWGAYKRERPARNSVKILTFPNINPLYWKLTTIHCEKNMPIGIYIYVYMQIVF